MRVLILITLIAFLQSSLLFSQENGTISGVVYDKKLKEPLFGATVRLLGTTKGAITDFSGSYTLNVAPGSYNIIISYISYVDDTIKDVNIEDGEALVKDSYLGDATSLIKAVVVQANKLNNTENSIIVQQQKSDKIQDGISKEELSRASASNVADGAKKVTGVSVQEGKYVSVRGLGDRYTNAQINGQSMPSTDPEKNSAQLDLIPSGLLDNIVVLKTFTPDQPGNFTGGNINIKTKEFPNKLFVNFSTSISYNSNSNLRDDFLSYEGGKTDWLGYDDGTRELPEILQDTNVLENLTKGFYIKARKNDSLAAILDLSAKSLNNNMTPIEINSPLNSGLAFSIGNSLKKEKHRFGYVATANYSHKFKAYHNGVFAQWQLNDKEAQALNDINQFDDNQSKEQAVVGAAVKLAYGYTSKHKVSLDMIYNHNGEKTARYQSGPYPGVISNTSNTFETRSILFKERSLINLQLNGQHRLEEGYHSGIKGIQFDWGLAYNFSNQKEPDLRFFANDFSKDSMYYISPSEYDLPYHYFRDLKDDVWQAKLDIKVPFGKKSLNNYVKLGYSQNIKNRSFEEDRFQLQTKDGVSYAGDDIAFFSYDNTGIIDFNENTGRYTFGNYITDESILANDYTGRANVMSTYAMGAINISKKLKMITGARAEYTDYLVESADTSLAKGEIKELDVLPSFNWIYTIDDKSKWKLRWSYNKTLARPTLREIAPYTANNFIGGFNVRGNPDLKRTNIDNLDLRLAYYPKAGELLAISAYYKNFKDPIIKTFTPLASNAELTFQNVDNAYLWGVEFEVRKSLSGISERLKNFKASANFSYVYSRSDIDSLEYAIISEVNPDFKPYRPFQGQSPYLANASLIYSNDSLGLDLNLGLNYFSNRLTEVSLFGTPDIYEKGRMMLSFNVSKSLGKYLSMRFGVSNLLDAAFNKVLNYKGAEYIYRSYLMGRTYKLSIQYSIN